MLFLAIRAVSAQPEFPSTEGYLGSEACRPCHTSIFNRQMKSSMRGTWIEKGSEPFGADYQESRSEGSSKVLNYLVSSHEKDLNFTVRMGDRQVRTLPIDAIMGGPRFGIGFLVKLTEFDGMALPQQPLIETRYRHDSQNGGLGLTAGHSPATPETWERAIGKVLTPDFAVRCLTCHGAPDLMPNGEAGVSCEVCHEAGQPHVSALQAAEDEMKIANPGNWSASRIVDFCGQCHGSDIDNLHDPRPEDLLISNQALSLSRSECFVQSGEAFSCITCHDPHQDARHGDPVYVETCRSCHGSGIQAAVCPVDSEQGCIECHMPSQREGNMVDHWIRIVPGTGTPTRPMAERMASNVVPKRLFLRIITVDNRRLAERIHSQLTQGGSFHRLAQAHSLDLNKVRGGYLGEMRPEKMARPLAEAARSLKPGAFSAVIPIAARYVILKRLPRDFRSRAIALEKEASELKQRRQIREAVRKYQEALEVYPHFLRALSALGVTLREVKDYRNSIAVLERAAHLYPTDSQIAYDLGLSYGLSGNTSREAQLQRRSLSLDPESVAARMRLGVLQFQSGRLSDAEASFREAVRLNPLLTAAYLNLGNTLKRQGKESEGEAVLEMAGRIQGNSGR